MSLSDTRVEIPADEIERLKLEVATHKARADAAEKERDAAYASLRALFAILNP